MFRSNRHIYAQIIDDERGHTLAANGIWYDALDFFSGWVERNPGETRLREQRTSLLQQVGLPEVADYERVLPSDSSTP